MTAKARIFNGENDRDEARNTQDDTDKPVSKKRRAVRADAATVDEGAQRRVYGGLNWGAAFFGWLVATGLGTILTALLFAAGSAVALTSFSSVSDVTSNQSSSSTVTIASAILLFIALAVAYYVGGYVAGRMSRFDGARQGAGVWVFGILITVLFAVVGALLGTKYNVLQQVNLPHFPLDKESFTTGGLVTFVAILLGTLLSAMSGGKVGQRYHRRVDRAGFVGA
jgi:hypothetical protein